MTSLKFWLHSGLFPKLRSKIRNRKPGFEATQGLHTSVLLASMPVATDIHTKLSVFIGYEYCNVLIRPKPISVSFALWV